MSSPRHQDHQNRIAKSTIAAIITLSISGFCLGIGIISYTVMCSRHDLQKEKKQLYHLSSARQSWANGDFSTCIIEANKISDGSSYADAQSLRNDCRKGLIKESLTIIRRLQSEGKYEEALNLVAPLAKGDAEAKKLMEEIASRLLETGKLHYQARSLSYLKNATEIIAVIPPVSDQYNTARTLIKQWYEEYIANREHVMTAQVALEQENASQAQQALEQVSVHPFWQNYVEAIRQETGFLVSYQTAKAFMERHEFQNAIAEANKLPNDGLWAERGSNLISRAETALQQQEFCETFSFGFFQCQR